MPGSILNFNRDTLRLLKEAGFADDAQNSNNDMDASRLRKMSGFVEDVEKNNEDYTKPSHLQVFSLRRRPQALKVVSSLSAVLSSCSRECCCQ